MKKQVLCLLAGSALLVGCSAPGMKELKAYCKKDAGEWIKKKVYTEGYYKYHEGFSSDLKYRPILEHGYQYMEFRKDTFGVADIIQDTGYFKIYKSEKGNAHCNEQYQRRLLRKARYEWFTGKYCLVVEKVDYPESRYWQVSKSEVVTLDNNHRSDISRNEIVVLDKGEDSMIAMRVNYRLAPTPTSQLNYGYRFGCSDVGVNVPTEINYVINPK